MELGGKRREAEGARGRRRRIWHLSSPGTKKAWEHPSGFGEVLVGGGKGDGKGAEGRTYSRLALHAAFVGALCVDAHFVNVRVVAAAVPEVDAVEVHRATCVVAVKVVDWASVSLSVP